MPDVTDEQWREGYIAFWEGRPNGDNPYDTDSPYWWTWRQGWEYAEDEAAEPK